MTIFRDDPSSSSGFVVASTSNSLCSLRSSSRPCVHRASNSVYGTVIGPFGFQRTCCSDQGYCGCCCGDSFDEEHFDKQMQREMERTRDKTVYTLVKPVETEPGSTDSMTVGLSPSQKLEPEYDVNSDDHAEVGQP